MSGQYERVQDNNYVVILPNTEHREELEKVLNGMNGMVQLYESTTGMSDSKKIIDLSRSESMPLSQLTHEMREGYKPEEVVYLLQEFVKGGDWKNSARLHRQHNDRQILDYVLKSLNPDTLDAHLSPTRSPDNLPQFREEVEPMMQKYRWLSDLYAGHSVSFEADIARICEENAFKVYVDRQESPRGISSIHGAFIDRIILRNRYFERLPAEHYPVTEEALTQALQCEYRDRFKDDPTTVEIDIIRDTLGSDVVSKIKNQLHREKKDAMLAQIQTGGLDDLLREETRIHGPSKNPVFKVDFSTSGQAQLKAVVKVFDSREEKKKEAKRIEFEQEVKAIRYFERMGLLDPVHFTYGRENGFRIIAMNYLDSENLIKIMEREGADKRYELAKEIVKKGARFNAFGPKTLAEGAVSNDPKERSKNFAARITGENAFFFPNMVKLLESQEIEVPDKDALETAISDGLGDVLQTLASATDYDTNYCDIYWPNWFGRRDKNEPTGYTWTKRDFGTLKVVPAQIDLVTPFVVGKHVREKREDVYRAYFDAYNEAIAEADDMLCKENAKVRRMLLQQTYRDSKKGDLAPDYACELVGEQTLAQCVYNHIRYKTTDEDFVPKAMFDTIIGEFNDRRELQEKVKEYVSDLSEFTENMRFKRRPFKDIDRFLFMAKPAEVKRGLVMSGFFAESALEHGLTQINLDYIRNTFDNAIEPLDELCNSDEFKRKREQLTNAATALRKLRDLTNRLAPNVFGHR